ncbi:EndoU domain-containing protein [Sebaldella sp. S0638]|nr:EndoU domain-containing protein [Sebaldella sp. S0638]
MTGTVKGGNKGYSTFFPDNWTAQQKVDDMNEAYNNRKPVANTRNTYEVTTKEGIIMEMYIDENTKKVISSFPKF